MGEIFGIIVLVIYTGAAVWAINKLYYSRVDTIVFGSYYRFLVGKVGIAMFFGWILIPIAIIVTIVENKMK